MPSERRALTSPTPPLTFAAFPAQALRLDKWPFRRAADGSLIDFSAGLRPERLANPAGVADCLWLHFTI